MSPRKTVVAAALATAALLACAFTGRAVLSSDGADMVSETLGFLVLGRFENASLPPATFDPNLPAAPPFHSRYGLFPSVVPLPFLSAAWPLRGHVSPAVVEGITALTWAAGAVLAALAFLRLARVLRPGTSPLWAPAFLGGTFLWPYAADSFMEPFAAAGLALAAACVLAPDDAHTLRRMVLGAAGVVCASWVRPILWITVPAFVLALLLERRSRTGGVKPVYAFGAAIGAGLAIAGLVNFVRYGSATELGYGFKGGMPFLNPLLDGVLGFTVHPGRGIVYYAPIVVAALFAARRLTASARVLCYAVPLLVLLVTCRWYGWHGGSAWGPRYLLPVLPLLAVPAIFLARAVVRPVLALGFLVNVLGVVVAPGAWIMYVELLKPPPGVTWPAPGGDRASATPALSPLYGHLFMAGTLAGLDMPQPWRTLGAVPTYPFAAADTLSPLLLRRAAGLGPIYPMLPRLLFRMAIARAYYGQVTEATLLTRAALRIDPLLPRARKFLAGLEGPNNPGK